MIAYAAAINFALSTLLPLAVLAFVLIGLTASDHED